MEDFDGILIFFIAIILMGMIYFGVVSVVKKSLNKAPTIESPFSQKDKDSLGRKIDDIQAQQRRSMEDMQDKIDDAKRQNDMKRDQMQNTLRDSQRRQQQLMQQQQQRIRDLQRR